MKKMFLLAATVCTLAAFQSCQKCGHCVTETTTTFGGSSTVNKNTGSIYCGDNGNESGSYRHAAELDCLAWPGRQTTQTGVSYTSSWETDK